MDKKICIEKLEKSLVDNYGIVFNNQKLLEITMIHSTYDNDNEKVYGNNERLEFLGDGIMKAALRDWLYKKYPSWSEGKLSKVMTEYESNEELREPAKRFGIHNYIILGNSFRGKVDKEASYMSDALEALIGAIYLDQGFTVSKIFVEKVILHDFDPNKNTDYISSVINYATEMEIDLSEDLIDENSGTHDNSFTIEVILGEYKGVGTGSSKPRAKKLAYKEIYSALQSVNRLMTMEYDVDYKTLIHNYCFDKYEEKVQQYKCRELNKSTVECGIYIRENFMSKGFGKTQKSAKIDAAKNACELLGLL